MAVRRIYTTFRRHKTGPRADGSCRRDHLIYDSGTSRRKTEWVNLKRHNEVLFRNRRILLVDDT